MRTYYLTLARDYGWRKRELGYSTRNARAYAFTRKGAKVIVEFGSIDQLTSAVTNGRIIDANELDAILRKR